MFCVVLMRVEFKGKFSHYSVFLIDSVESVGAQLFESELVFNLGDFLSGG